MSSKGSHKPAVLVVGIGNTLRSDDGVGPYVAESIEAKGLANVKVWVTQQLHVEDIESMTAFAKIILVDASTTGPGVDLRKVETQTGQEAPSSSHHLSAGMLKRLAHDLYHKDLNIHVCSIRGKNFEAGDKLSSQALYCARKAIELIGASITEGPHA